VTRYRRLEDFNILRTLFSKKRMKNKHRCYNYKRRAQQSLTVQVLLALGILGGDGEVEALELNLFIRVKDSYFAFYSFKLYIQNG
jgi:hypothetical protein